MSPSVHLKRPVHRACLLRPQNDAALSGGKGSPMSQLAAR
jgi:hypothetical protein